MKKLIYLPLIELVTHYPDIAAVLQKHHIDTQEYHHTTLSHVLQSTRFFRAELMTDVTNAIIASACAQYKTENVKQLTCEIVKNFHNPHRAQMYGLISDANDVEQKYAEHHRYPVGLHALLIDFFDDLSRHMEQEEQFLFPSLITAGEFHLFPQLLVASHSHDRHIKMMAKINSMTDYFAAPSDASIEWQELYENLLEFVLQLNMHIAIENQFLLDD